MKTAEEKYGRSAVRIYINGEEQFSFTEGEPEDASLCRDYADVFSIPEALERAWKLGFQAAKDGKTESDVVMESKEVSWEELFE